MVTASKRGRRHHSLPRKGIGPFSKLHRATHLPCRKQIVQYQGNLTGTGYAEKLRWAAFSSSKGEVHHGPPNNAPKQEGLADGGLGASFSPFFEPNSLEIRYCVKLSDWWREVKPKVDTGDTKLQIEEKANRSYRQISRSQRVHRLISEAGPSVPPDGYFDCTIEVCLSRHVTIFDCST